MLRIYPRIGLLLVTLIWGYTFVTVKESLVGIDVFSFLFYRFALGFFLLIAIFRNPLKKTLAGDWYKGFLIGAVLFGGFAFQTWGLRYTTATNSGFVTGLSVVLVPLFAKMIFHERIQGRHWLGALLSSLGLGMIVLSAGLTTLNLGDLITLGTAFCFALQILFIGHYCQRENYVSILVAQIGVTALLSAVGAFLVGGPIWPHAYSTWKGIMITGLLATALALWGQNRFQADVTATEAAIIFTMEPVFAALFGYLLLAERLSGQQWIGALLILVAMLVSQWPTNSFHELRGLGLKESL